MWSKQSPLMVALWAGFQINANPNESNFRNIIGFRIQCQICVGIIMQRNIISISLSFALMCQYKVFTGALDIIYYCMDNCHGMWVNRGAMVVSVLVNRNQNSTSSSSSTSSSIYHRYCTNRVCMLCCCFCFCVCGRLCLVLKCPSKSNLSVCCCSLAFPSNCLKNFHHYPKTGQTNQDYM